MGVAGTACTLLVTSALGYRLGLPTLAAGSASALLVLAAVYLLVCAFAHEKRWHVRGHELRTPTLRMALLQFLLSCTNWSLIGGVIWLLLQGQVAYPQVLAVLLVAAVAGVITHVPAGLGVLEAVFVALLAHQVAEAQLLAALLAYRGLYYLLPLVVATLAYFATELRARRVRRARVAHQKLSLIHI